MAITLSREFGNSTLTFESGKLALQAGGSCVVTYGETQVLATCTTAQPREGIDFFPLTIDVEERMYAAGKIPGGFFRREGRPSETAILTARLTDRPMRPSFKDGYRDEVQVVITVLSVDMARQYDIPGMNAASLATMLSGIPFEGPVGSVRHRADRRRVGHQPHVPGPGGGHVRHRGRRPPQRFGAGRHPDDRG